MVVAIDSVLEDNAALLAAGDVAGLVARYAPDAQIVHATGVARGSEEIEALFSDQSRHRPQAVAVEMVGRSEDTVAYRARMRVDGTEVGVVGSMVLRGGLIWRQTTVVVEEP